MAWDQKGWVQAYDPMSGPVAGQWIHSTTGEVYFGDRPPGETFSPPGVTPSGQWDALLRDYGVNSSALAGALGTSQPLGDYSSQIAQNYNPSQLEALQYIDPRSAALVDAGVDPRSATSLNGMSSSAFVQKVIDQAAQVDPTTLPALNKALESARLAEATNEQSKARKLTNNPMQLAAIAAGAVGAPYLLGGLFPGAAGLSASGAGGMSVPGIGAAMDASVVGSAVPGFDLAAAGMYPLSGGAGAITSLPTFTGGDVGFFDDLLSGIGDEWTSGFDLGAGEQDWTWANPGSTPAPSSLENWWQNLTTPNLSTVGNAATTIFGSDSITPGGVLNGLFGGGGIGDLLGSAASVAPILGAFGYAASQDPFDTSRLESLYSQYSPEANTFEYDLNTGQGRNKLTSNLARRGVMGSSFGNMDMASYDTLRELGRESLINQGVGTAGSLANSILGAQVEGRKTKNQLYGSALNALGMALSPKSVGIFGG